MATQSLPQSGETPQTYTIKEFQLLVRDRAAIPAAIQPFVGAPFTCSVEIFRRFQGLLRCAPSGGDIRFSLSETWHKRKWDESD